MQHCQRAFRPSTGDQAIGQIGLGDTVQAIAKSGDWYQIDFSGGTGWVAGWLVQADQSSAGESSGLATVDTNMQLQALCSTVNVRSGPSTGDQVIGQIGLGDTVQTIAKSGDWYQIDFSGGTGWVAGWLVQAYQPSAEGSRELAPDVISTAERFLGTPYCYGANGPYSFDCSGFTRYVYSLFGINLPRVASDQALAGTRVASPAPGDLVFFSACGDGYITHVGIYIGNNSFINAADQGVSISSLDDPWFRDHYVMACRVL